jgi:O-antigen/teichoic acid export membrane protein
MKSLLSFLQNLNPDFVKLLKGSGLVMAFKVLGALAGYVLAYVITTNYGAESFGIFELSLTFLTIVGVLGRLGLDGALVRFIPEFQEKGAFNLMRSAYRFALGVALPISLLLSVVLYLSSDALAAFFGTQELAQGFRITSFIIPLSTWMGLNSESFRGMKNMVAYSIYQRGTVVLIAVAGIFILEWSSVVSEHIPLISFGIGVGVLAIIAGFSTPYKLSHLGTSTANPRAEI